MPMCPETFNTVEEWERHLRDVHRWSDEGIFGAKIASIHISTSRETNLRSTGGPPDERKPSDADPGSGLGQGEASGVNHGGK